MPFAPTQDTRRCGVVDLGSNSVRLVVYEGENRNPLAILNEKAVLRLGRGLQASGRLNDEGAAQALVLLSRYHAIARAMAADPFEVLATAAVRDASNGPDFVAAAKARMPGVTIRILSGAEEAAYSAAGVMCGIPDADGVLADIGGGSLELVRLGPSNPTEACTLPLGVIRLAERAGGDLSLARAIIEADLRSVPWLPDVAGRSLYLVGGAWRALARIHMVQTGYPLPIIHHYTLERDALREFANGIVTASRRALERLPAVSRRRLDDLPFAAIVLRRLLRDAAPAQVVFSANGLREGWFMRRLPKGLASEDPLLAAGRHYATWIGRTPRMPPALIAWTGAVLPDPDAAERRLREAACWMSDIGSRDHPEFRAEQAFLRVLRQPGIGIDHFGRAFLALAVAVRYDAPTDAAFLRPARALLDPGAAHRAETLGVTLRLGYLLSAGTPELLAGATLRVRDGRLLLGVNAAAGVLAGEGVLRRLERLALLLGMPSAVEEISRSAA